MKRHAGARTCPHCRLLIVSRIMADGSRPSHVARELRVSTPTVRKWLRRYRQGGAAGLQDGSSVPHSSPTRLEGPGAALHDAVMTVLHAPPRDHGLNRTSWRLQDIKDVLAKKGTLATLKSIRLEIRKSGVRWRRARIALTSTYPEYRARVDAIKAVLAHLGTDEAFFSIDELGPVAVKMRGGRSLQIPGPPRSIPQWQKSRGAFILTAALDLRRNRITCLFSDKKNSHETIRLIERLRTDYGCYRTLYLSWDAAPWHSSAQLRACLLALNQRARSEHRPTIEVVPLPKSAQFLNVIESVFSGMARAILHNSDYATLEDAKLAVTRYFDDRNDRFRIDPRRAGKTIWGKEIVPIMFDEANNCKDPRWLG
jgi:transposase